MCTAAAGALPLICVTFKAVYASLLSCGLLMHRCPPPTLTRTHRHPHPPAHVCTAQMRQYRKDIADLLKAGKLDYAIIRVESVIREQLTLTGEHRSMC
jgi:hypothetical protein